jgi:hypothetical protein
MPDRPERQLIAQCYQAKFGAVPDPSFSEFMRQSRGQSTAVLGYRRATHGPLFLEAYLDLPIEACVSSVLGRSIPRERIVELGNLAASNAIAMLELWGAAANDLGDSSEVAVATLTAPLRKMFARIGLAIHEIAPAHAEKLGEAADCWGDYYAADPKVCVGAIAQGQRAIARFLARRGQGRAA